MRYWLAVAAWLVCFPATLVAAPNFVVLVADDLRPDTIHALGNDHIHTPNLDRLVREGTTFTRAVAAHPLCVPSRAELITGCTSFRNGIPYGTEGLDESLTTWPAALSSAGYVTWYVGKWHTQGNPHQRGYHETRGFYGSGNGELTYPVDHRGKPVTGYRGWQFRTNDNKRLPELGIGLTPDISKLFADAAIELIERRPEQPFLLHVNFTAPHDPLFFPTGYESKYDPAQLPLPTNYLPEHPFDHGNFRGRDELLMDWPRTPEEVRRELAVYYAVISHLDAQVGRILDTLDATGQADNTIVVFTSDHGLAVGSHGLRGKQNMYDHTLGIPMIFRGPGIPANQRSKAACYLRDLYPTTCELAGAPIPETVEAQSLAPVLRGETDSIHDAIFGYFMDSQRAIRTERWKLIHYPLIDRWQLFDLENDPYEVTDLIDRPEHAETIAQLKARLHQWEKENNDPLVTGRPWNNTRRSGDVRPTQSR